MLYWHGEDPQCAVYVTYMFKQADRWAFPPKYTCCDGGSGQRKCTRQEHRWKQAESLCSPPHPPTPHPSCISNIWGPSGVSAHRTCSRVHTHSTGSPVLAGRRGEGRCQHQQMPHAPVLEGPLLFLPSLWNPRVFVCCCSPCLAEECFAILAAFYLSASVGSERAWSPGDMGWRFNQPGAALRSERGSFGGFCFTVSSCCSVVACGAMSTTPSTKSIPRTQWRGDSTSGINLGLAGMENK